MLNKNELPEYWHLIRLGLKYMIDNKRNPDGWTIESVFNALLHEKASCVFTSIHRNKKKRGRKAEQEPSTTYASRHEALEDSCGFGIVQVLDGPDGKTFHIWIAVSNDTTNKQEAPSILTTFHKEVWDAARANGCKFISFGTNQDWWETLAPRFGFEKQEVKWRTEIK
ncbi:hypothetical protein BG58_11095 [Caballeronia jiangsuensis]|nr:hypothetical protein BG58_11095 [Caballeronia jiangsuensis]